MPSRQPIRPEVAGVVGGEIAWDATTARGPALLLDHGGVAFDDYTDHAWTSQEIQSGASVDGLRFFDFGAYHWSEQADRRRRDTAAAQDR